MQNGWAASNLGHLPVGKAAGEWVFSARPEQYPLDMRRDTWLVIGGRGSGKTRLGAEWVNGLVRGLPPFSLHRYGMIALVGETLGDVREVMIDGPSGILGVSRHDRPRYEVVRRRLVWDNGAVAQIFSSEDPDSLRGPQFEAAWCDELAKWARLEATYDMLQFGLRLGQRPRQLITTTPRPLPLIRRLLSDPAVSVTRMRTEDNAAHLAGSFLSAVRARYGGTRLGRQELDGEIIEDREDALWSRTLLEGMKEPPGRTLTRIVVAIDPPASARASSDACGIVAGGRDPRGPPGVGSGENSPRQWPGGWGGRVGARDNRLEADCLVAEVNQGGDMVTAVIRAVDERVPVRAVRASRGKWLRAEPVAALYEQGRVFHAARFSELEDEMCDFGPDGLASRRSPDRVDALVWAVTDLLLTGGAGPRIRDFS